MTSASGNCRLPFSLWTRGPAIALMVAVILCASPSQDSSSGGLSFLRTISFANADFTGSAYCFADTSCSTLRTTIRVPCSSCCRTLKGAVWGKSCADVASGDGNLCSTNIDCAAAVVTTPTIQPSPEPIIVVGDIGVSTPTSLYFEGFDGAQVAFVGTSNTVYNLINDDFFQLNGIFDFASGSPPNTSSSTANENGTVIPPSPVPVVLREVGMTIGTDRIVVSCNLFQGSGSSVDTSSGDISPTATPTLTATPSQSAGTGQDGGSGGTTAITPEQRAALGIGISVNGVPLKLNHRVRLGTGSGIVKHGEVGVYVTVLPRYDFTFQLQDPTLSSSSSTASSSDPSPTPLPNCRIAMDAVYLQSSSSTAPDGLLGKTLDSSGTGGQTTASFDSTSSGSSTSAKGKSDTGTLQFGSSAVGTESLTDADCALCYRIPAQYIVLDGHVLGDTYANRRLPSDEDQVVAALSAAQEGLEYDFQYPGQVFRRELVSSTATENP